MDVSESGRIYAALGYDFIAVTDHDKTCKRRQLESWREQTGLVVIPGVEVGGDGHMLELGVINASSDSGENFRTRAEASRNGNGFIVGCHPQESPEGEQRLRRSVEWLHAFEIYNGLREARGTDESRNIALWDEILTAGGRIWAAAVDDFHCSYITPGHGWVCVQVPEDLENVTSELITEQLKRGCFYASTYPAFHEFKLQDGMLNVTGDARVLEMRVIGPGGRILQQSDGPKLKWDCNPGPFYFRVEARMGVKIAWSQPFFQRTNQSPDA